jgi:hypothetical protein
MHSSRSGIGAALETMRPQRPGGCVKNPVSLRRSKLDQRTPCRADAQSIFFSRTIRYSHKLSSAFRGPAALWTPDRLARLPKRIFARDSNIVQQPIVQIAQVLAQTPLANPRPDRVKPACLPGRAARSAGKDATRFLNGWEVRHSCCSLSIGWASAQSKSQAIEPAEPCQQSINSLPCPRFPHESRRCRGICHRLTG